MRTPETKGNAESSNRFINWLLSYDGKFNVENGLIDIISQMTAQYNSKVNETTSVPPIILFKKEKE